MAAYYSAVRSLASTFFGLVSGWDVKGRENLPFKGGLIVACNHISFWDPPMVGSACPRELYFLAKEELFATPLLGPLIRSLHSIPIRRGVADLGYVHVGDRDATLDRRFEIRRRDIRGHGDSPDGDWCRHKPSMRHGAP